MYIENIYLVGQGIGELVNLSLCFPCYIKSKVIQFLLIRKERGGGKKC